MSCFCGPASPGTGFSVDENIRPGRGASEIPKRLVLATIYYFDAPVTDDFLEFFESTIKPVTAAAGATILAYFVSEQSENTFPALPVRQGENVFVWFARFSDPSCVRPLSCRAGAIPTLARKSCRRVGSPAQRNAGNIEAIANTTVRFCSDALSAVTTS